MDMETTQTKISAKNKNLPLEKISKTAVYYSAFLILGSMASIVGTTLSDLMAHTHSQLDQISYLFTTIALGYIIGALLSGHIYDRLKGHKVMAVALGLVALVLFVMPLVSALWGLLVISIILGIGQSSLDVGGNTLLVWVHKDKVAPYINGLHFCFGAGAFLSPLIIALVTQLSGDITWGYWILGLFTLPLIAILLRLESPVIEGHADKIQGAPQKMNWILIALITAFVMLYSGGEISFGNWIFTYSLESGIIADTNVARYLNSAFWGAFTIGRLLSIPVAAKIRPHTILLSAIGGGLASLGVILLGAHSATLTWIGTISFGLCISPIFPTAITFAKNRMRITGKVNSFIFAGGSLGGMVLPWIIGQLFEGFGPQTLPLTLIIDMVVILGLCVLLMSYKKKPDAEIS